MTNKQCAAPPIVSAILGLSIANSFAYITSNLSRYDIVRESPGNAPEIPLETVLGLVGLGLGAFPIIYICRKLCSKYFIALAALLLSLCNWAPELYPQIDVFLWAHLIGGVCGAVPIYATLLMFASEFDGLVGTNKAIVVFATIGGLGAGPIIGSLSPLFFGYSSILVAFLALSLPKEASQWSEKSRSSQEPPATNEYLGIYSQPISYKFLIFLWASLFTALQCIRVPAGSLYLTETNFEIFMPYCAIVLGALVAALDIRAEDRNENNEEQVMAFYASILGQLFCTLATILGTHTFCRYSFVQRHCAKIFCFLGFMLGKNMALFTGSIIASQVDLCARKGIPSVVKLAMVLFLCGFLVYLFLASVAQGLET